MGDVFLDAFLDTLKILPFLLAMNLLLELIESKAKWNKVNKSLKGGIAPLIGTGVGIVPQCGFSVVATELYCKRRIALGTLLAVYIATSDEALPIMLSNFELGLDKILPVLIIKICFALLVGYSVFAVEKLIERTSSKDPDSALRDAHGNSATNTGHIDNTANKAEECDAHAEEHRHEFDADGELSEHDDSVHAHIYGCHHHEIDAAPAPDATASKKQKAAYIWNTYFKHPLIHTATVLIFILIVNIVFGIAVYYVGEDRIAAFIGATGYWQPFLAGLVGLIPNCAASVVITELYLVGGLNLGGAIAGLCVSAGIGYAVLIKHNRPILNSALIIAGMYTISTVLGVIVNLIA